MLRSSIPTKMPLTFASGAGSGYITPVPQLPPASPGRASFQKGFPPVTFEQIAAGGTPPWGADMNGILNAITTWLQWSQAGGFPINFDSSFAASIGGYPQYALLLSSTPGAYGKMWLSTVDSNSQDPDSPTQTQWVLFPDVLIQLQANNYAVDTGPVNQVQITLGRAPASWTEIIGTPIRFKIGHANTVNNPTIAANGLSPITIVNPDGSSLGIGQMVLGAIADGFPRDDGKFQLNSPAKQYSPSGTFPMPGFVMPWPTETPPSGFIECNGASLVISAYPNLWAVLGTRYGGDGVTTFNLPDYRGEFLRGWDHGRGLDPNAATRTNAGGGLVGDHVGTNQASSLKSSDLGSRITITNPTPTPPYDSGVAYDGLGGNVLWGLWEGGGTAYQFGSTLDASSIKMSAIDHIIGNFSFTGGGIETRPVNINVMWVMFTG